VSDLVQFLRARYGEAREAEGRKVSLPGNLPFQWRAVYDPNDQHVVIDGLHRVGMDEFFERYGESAADPDVLADLDAKLAILDLHARLGDSPFCVTCDAPSGIPGRPDGCTTLRLLALPFAAHLDYDERWRP